MNLTLEELLSQTNRTRDIIRPRTLSWIVIIPELCKINCSTKKVFKKQKKTVSLYTSQTTLQNKVLIWLPNIKVLLKSTVRPSLRVTLCRTRWVIHRSVDLSLSTVFSYFPTHYSTQPTTTISFHNPFNLREKRDR